MSCSNPKKLTYMERKIPELVDLSDEIAPYHTPDNF